MLSHQKDINCTTITKSKEQTISIPSSHTYSSRNFIFFSSALYRDNICIYLLNSWHLNYSPKQIPPYYVCFSTYALALSFYIIKKLGAFNETFIPRSIMLKIKLHVIQLRTKRSNITWQWKWKRFTFHQTWPNHVSI